MKKYGICEIDLYDEVVDGFVFCILYFPKDKDAIKKRDRTSVFAENSSYDQQGGGREEGTTKRNKRKKQTKQTKRIKPRQNGRLPDKATTSHSTQISDNAAIFNFPEAQQQRSAKGVLPVSFPPQQHSTNRQENVFIPYLPPLSTATTISNRYHVLPVSPSPKHSNNGQQKVSCLYLFLDLALGRLRVNPREVRDDLVDALAARLADKARQLPNEAVWHRFRLPLGSRARASSSLIDPPPTITTDDHHQ